MQRARALCSTLPGVACQPSSRCRRQRNVYAFGCGFIHLSVFHDYPDRDPFDLLTSQDRTDIGRYLSYYHGIRVDAKTKLIDIEPVLPAVFDK